MITGKPADNSAAVRLEVVDTCIAIIGVGGGSHADDLRAIAT